MENIAICVKCRNFYENSHKKCLCKAVRGIVDFVHGTTGYKHCKDVNTDGKCKLYDPKETNAHNNISECGCPVGRTKKYFDENVEVEKVGQEVKTVELNEYSIQTERQGFWARLFAADGNSMTKGFN